ncbi:MAG: hypothetical protein WC052_02180 [Patescibacteria group bacterium]
MKILGLTVRSEFDSRGEETIAVSVVDGEKHVSEAFVPAGKSRGSGEASVFSLIDAKRSVTALQQSLTGKSFQSISEFDSVLLGVDGTQDKNILGGNVMLGLSTAVARAIATTEKRELWELMRSEFFPHVQAVRPKVYANFINGGAHADNGLAIQEYHIVGSPMTSYEDLTIELVRFYRALGLVLATQPGPVPIGDESGYATQFSDSLRPLSVLTQLLAEAGSERFTLAIDAAASSFFRDGVYEVDGDQLSTNALAELYGRFLTTAPLLKSIEDPFAEHDADGFRVLRDRRPDLQVVGDDLTVTNAAKIETFAASGCINAVIIKPNQVGTVSEACQAIVAARRHKVQVIVSHRSGETEDPFIISLAKACAADGVKIGAPMHERISKYNELIRLFDGLT